MNRPLNTHFGMATFYGPQNQNLAFDAFWAITGTVAIDNNDTYVYGGQNGLYLTPNRGCQLGHADARYHAGSRRTGCRFTRQLR